MIAIIHSGRRGTELEIVPKTIEAIANHLCIKPGEISAGLYPGICEKCYEVGPEIAKKFPSEFVHDNHLNLRQMITEQIHYSGIYQVLIRSPFCSYCSKENGEYAFRSHRREPDGKRNAVFIAPFKFI